MIGVDWRGLISERTGASTTARRRVTVATRSAAGGSAGDAAEGPLDPARADEAGRQHLQLLDRDPRLIERRGIPARLADEVGCLQPLAHRRARQQGTGNITEQVEEQAQEDAPGPQTQIAKRGPVRRCQQFAGGEARRKATAAEVGEGGGGAMANNNLGA